MLAIRPDYLVLDEPLSGLDPENREALLKLLKSLHMQGSSVIVVSHWIADLLPLADKIILMENGKISFEGSPEKYIKATSTPLPEITSLMKELQQKGFDVRDDIFDVEEALNEIIRVKKERSGSMQ